MKAGIFNMDCMKAMEVITDNFFELAIIDPPYGIGIDGQKKEIKNGVQIRKGHEFKGWDILPTKEYFNELKRVSQDQILWGANYYPEYLTKSKGWIVWYKGQMGLTMSDAELAYSSISEPTRVINIHRTHLWQEKPIHPTQKPIKLYEWLLMNYAKEGDKILDTHLGSGSSAIAAHRLGFEFWGFEIDKDYYDAAVKRINLEKTKLQLF